MTLIAVYDELKQLVYLNVDKIESIVLETKAYRYLNSTEESKCLRIQTESGNNYFFFGDWKDFAKKYPRIYSDELQYTRIEN